MIRAILTACALSTSLVVQAQSNAEYRTDVPEVLAPKNDDVVIHAPDPGAQRRAFNQAYSKAAKPEIIVFWQRVLTDQLEDGDYRSSSTRTDLGRLREGFVSVLVESGVKMVSREFGTRAVAAERMIPADKANRQHLELLALSEYADKVLEVLLLDDSNATRLGFSLRLIDTKSGLLEIDAQRSLSTGHQSRERVLVADSKGLYYSNSVEQLSERQIGEKLAELFMTLYLERQ